MKLLHDFNVKSEKSCAIHWAILHDRLHILRHFMKVYRIDGNAIVNFRTPLTLAIEHRYEEALEFLLSSEEIQINRCDSPGQSALYLTVGYGDASIVQLLLKRPDIDPNYHETNWAIASYFVTIRRGLSTVLAPLLSDPRLNPNIIDLFGKTTLLLAMQLQAHPAIKILAGDPRVPVIRRDSWRWASPTRAVQIPIVYDR